jgi:LysM repeat protein
LHLNAAPNPAANGAEGWYGAAGGGSELAGAVLAALAAPLRSYEVGVRGTRAGPQLAVLRGGMPAALVEVGYVTNARDASVLRQEAFLAAAAEGIAAGIAAFRDGWWSQPAAQRGAPAAGGGVKLANLAGMYFVQPGDTLAAIATRLGFRLDEVARVNPAAVAQSLLAGQPIQLPAPAQRADASDAGSTPAVQRAVLATGATAAIRPVGITPGTASYTVRPGDTLFSIARGSGVSVADLARLNQIQDTDLVLAGQTLRLKPADQAGRPGDGRSSPAGRRYPVAPGETLSEIALRLGVRQQALAAANGIADPDLVLAGSILTVPDP